MNKIKAFVVAVFINIPVGVWYDVASMWRVDISGTTMDEFSGFPAYRYAHPRFAKFLDYLDAVLRLILYWCGTGFIGIVGPVIAIDKIWVNRSIIIAHGTGAILGVAAFFLLVLMLWILWVGPYFYSKAIIPKKLNP